MRRTRRSDLEAAGLSLAAGLLELAALGTDTLRGVAVGHARRSPEEALGLAGLGRTAEQDGALAQRRAEGQLVESDALATRLRDLRAGALREAERAHGELGHLVEPLVARDWAADHGDLAILPAFAICA